MGFELEQDREKQEGKIDLTYLSIVFCDDDFVRAYYKTKKSEMLDKDKWIEKNREHLERGRERIAQSIENGLIPNGNPETIWKFQSDMIENEEEKSVKVKGDLEEKIEVIKGAVAKRLSKFLPDWKLKQATVTFTVNDKADFCVDGNEITVDIGRLILDKDATEKVIEGITHEVFHVWMKEKIESNDELDKAMGRSVLFRTIDEGLAVLVSGQSLARHHEKQGRNYEEYVLESFRIFKDLLEHGNCDGLAGKYISEAFENMGHAYVVGNEIVKRVLQKIGIGNFRKLIDECRLRPERMLDEYRKL